MKKLIKPSSNNNKQKNISNDSVYTYIQNNHKITQSRNQYQKLFDLFNDPPIFLLDSKQNKPNLELFLSADVMKKKQCSSNQFLNIYQPTYQFVLKSRSEKLQQNQAPLFNCEVINFQQQPDNLMQQTQRYVMQENQQDYCMNSIIKQFKNPFQYKNPNQSLMQDNQISQLLKREIQSFQQFGQTSQNNKSKKVIRHPITSKLPNKQQNKADLRSNSVQCSMLFINKNRKEYHQTSLHIPKTLLKMRLQYLQHLIRKNPYITTQNLFNKINQNSSLLYNNQPLKRQYFNGMLKNLSARKRKIVKIPKEKNSPETIEKRYHFCKQFIKLLKDQQVIYTIGELRFKIYECNNQVWLFNGKPIEPQGNLGEDKNISLLCLMNPTTMLNWAGMNGKIPNHYYDYFISKALQILDNQRTKSFTLVLDQSQFSQKFLTKLNQTSLKNAKILVVPNYSAELNPLQHFFQELKRDFVFGKCFKDVDRTITRNELIEEIKFILTIKTRNYKNYYQKVHKNAVKGVQRQPF